MGRIEALDAEIISVSPTLPFSHSPPWELTGEALVLLRDAKTVLALVNYHTSPVGPYRELAEATLMRRSKYFGPSVLKMWVDSVDSMREGRAIWGFPKTLHPLAWRREERKIEFRASDGDKVLWWRARTIGPSFPIAVRGFCVQELNGQAVKVPISFRGRARLALRGKQLAIAVNEFTMSVEAPQA